MWCAFTSHELLSGTTVSQGQVARSQCSAVNEARCIRRRFPPVPLPTTSGESAERTMAGSRTSAAVRGNGKKTAGVAAKNGRKNAGRKADTKTSALHDDEALTPLAVSDALSRTANETCHQRDRRARLSQIGAAKWELSAAEALVDTCDLALEECVREFEKQCRNVPLSDSAEVRTAASALWLAAREYIRRLSIANRASRQLTQQHDADAFGDLHLEYELEASSLLALKQAVGVYKKLRPEGR